MSKKATKTGKQSLTYTGGGSQRVHQRDGTIHTIRKGDTVERGDIPDDAFLAFSVRPDFGASLDEYRRSRVPGFTHTKLESKTDKPIQAMPKAAIADAPKKVKD